MCCFFVKRDGTSIVLSDDVGQIYLLNTGQGESQKDAKYDQVYEAVSFILIIILSILQLLYTILRL